MKKSILFLTIFSFLLLNEGFSQDEKNNSLEFSLGMSQLTRQELSFSPLIYKTWSPANLQINYQKDSRFTHDVSVRFNLYKDWTVDQYTYYWDENQQNAESTFAHQFTLLDINYGISKSIFETNNWNLELGLRERNRLQITNFAWGIADFLAYNFSFSLDANFAIEYKINEKQHISSKLWLPLFGYHARSPWATQDGKYFENSSSNKPLPTVIEYIKRGKFQSWNTSQVADLDISYLYQLNERWAVGAKYLLSMNFNQDPRNLSSIENHFYFTSKISF